MSFWTDRPPHPGTGPAVRRVADLRLRGRAAPLRARVHWPAPAGEASAPALLVLFPAGHGQGGLGRADAACRGLCARAGVVVVSVPYRLTPASMHPAALHDATAAVEWAANHGAELDADPDRLLVAGQAVGGGLAAAVALHARDQHWPALVRQVLVTPCFTHPAVLGDPLIAPLHTLSVAGVAPATVLTVAGDPRGDDGRRYAARLRRAGVEVEELRCSGPAQDGRGRARDDGVTGQDLADLAGAVRRALSARAPPRRPGPAAWRTPAADDTGA